MVKKMTTAQKLILQLIRYEITGTPLDAEFQNGISDDVLSSVYEISVDQSVSVIVGNALFKLGVLTDELKQAFFNEQLVGIYNVEQIHHELENIVSLFEKEKIPFIPLKGSVLRSFYPKPEMRESCDIDILIQREDLERACKSLETEYGYEKRTGCAHDVGLFSKSDVELELHFSLYESYNDKKELLDNVWDYASPCADGKYEHKLTPEFFTVYHLIHMYKHVVNGGCGVKPFMDLKIIEDNFDLNFGKLDKLVENAGIAKFSKRVFDLMHFWFCNGKNDEYLELFADYIFTSGTYGTLENQVAVSLSQNGNKFKNLMDRIFMPYNKLRVIYPVLNDKPYLMPWYEVKRWHRIIFKDKMEQQLIIMKHNANIDLEKQNKTTKLMENLGIK